jgi:hypothetical protein
LTWVNRFSDVIAADLISINSKAVGPLNVNKCEKYPAMASPDLEERSNDTEPRDEQIEDPA